MPHETVCGGADNFKKIGTYWGWQRYMHKDCGHTFNDLTNTPIHGSKYPEKWASYLQAMEQGLSLRKCAKLVDISLQASNGRRHKIACPVPDQNTDARRHGGGGRNVRPIFGKGEA